MPSQLNGRVFLRARSAVKQGQRPTAAIREEGDPHNNWERLDYMLQDAIFILESETCPRCHNPIWLCHSYDNTIDFKVKVRTCYATAEKEEFESSKENPELGAGEYTIASPIGIENEDGTFEKLPSRLEAYGKMPQD